jgi:predicted AAA+ superfamily ATPase
LTYRDDKMDKLFQYSISRINQVSTGFKRYLWGEVDWNNRLISITGARGVGKTTFLLQHIKESFSDLNNEVLFVNLDDLYFSKNTLIEFAGEFVKRGGKYLFLDEVHKYLNWSIELKNAYDYFPELNIVITASSALDIFKGKADLSRRAIDYHIQGLSLREFLEMKYGYSFPVIDLKEVLLNPSGHIRAVMDQIKPIRYFEEYLKIGYYPYFMEDEKNYHYRIRQVVNRVLDIDLPSVENIDYTSVYKLRKLLSIIAELVPFKPNILKLSEQVEVSRETFIKYLYLLSKADLLMLLQQESHGISKMNKPEKVYLENPNLMYAISDSNVNTGTIRETFFYNQMKASHTVVAAEKGDFIADNRYTIEVGGKNKTSKQLQGIENSFIAADNIEYSYQNRIPLWLFGFLY